MTVTLAPVRALLGHPLVKASVASAVIVVGVSIVHTVQQELQDRLNALNEAIGHRTAELQLLRAQAARARAGAGDPATSTPPTTETAEEVIADVQAQAAAARERLTDTADVEILPPRAAERYLTTNEAATGGAVPDRDV